MLRLKTHICCSSSVADLISLARINPLVIILFLCLVELEDELSYKSTLHCILHTLPPCLLLYITLAKPHPKCLREDLYRWAEGSCRSKGENNSELSKVVVMRREGLSQVFGVVQLMVPSLPALPREKEGVGEMGRGCEDSRDVREKTTFLVN